MKRRILESEEKLLVDDEKDDNLDGVGSKLNFREDLIDSILLNYEEAADYLGIGFWGPRHEELESYTDEELEQEFKESKSTLEYASGQVNDLEYSDREDNKEYFDDLDAKSSEDSEIEDLAGLGPEDGEEFHTFAGMGKGRHGRNRIHEVTPQQTKYVSPVPKKPRSFWRMMFPGLADEIDLFTGNHTKEIKKHYQNQSAEADRERIKREREAQQNKEDEIRREKNYQDQKAARAASDEKYRGMNRDQRDQAYLDSKGKRIQTDYENGRFVKTVVPIKENTMSNKITIGQLRQIIKEELDKVLIKESTSQKVIQKVAFFKSNPSAWQMAKDEIEYMADGDDAGGIRNQYYPGWSDNDFKELLQQMGS